jgi:hypothetical protein
MEPSSNKPNRSNLPTSELTMNNHQLILRFAAGFLVGLLIAGISWATTSYILDYWYHWLWDFSDRQWIHDSQMGL